MKYGHSYCVEACCLNQPLLKLRNAPAKYRHYWAYAWFWLALMTRSSLTAIIKIYPKQKSLRDYFVPPPILCLYANVSCQWGMCLCALWNSIRWYFEHHKTKFNSRPWNSGGGSRIKMNISEPWHINHNSQCALCRRGWINVQLTVLFTLIKDTQHYIVC